MMWTTVAAVLLCADGVAVGVLSVFLLPMHIGSVPVPVGAIVAAVVNPGLVALGRAVSNRLLTSALPLIGWVVVFLAATVGGPGGDAVLPGDWRSLLLLFLGGVPALLLMGDHALGRSFARGSAARPG